MITIITGAPGSGKTKTAKLLFETTDMSAWVDGDSALTANPSDRNLQRSLRYKNIASQINNYIDSGFTNAIISFVYVRNEDIKEQISLLNNNEIPVKVIALVTDAETLSKRHLNDDYKRVNVEESINLNNKIKLLENVDFIDNSNLTIEETVSKIKETINQQ
jgi:dephospho-CoA kinase